MLTSSRAEPGTCAPNRSVSSSRPASRSRSTQTATKVLVIEPIRYCVSSSAGRPCGAPVDRARRAAPDQLAAAHQPGGDGRQPPVALGGGEEVVEPGGGGGLQRHPPTLGRRAHRWPRDRPRGWEDGAHARCRRSPDLPRRGAAAVVRHGRLRPRQQRAVPPPARGRPRHRLPRVVPRPADDARRGHRGHPARHRVPRPADLPGRARRGRHVGDPRARRRLRPRLHGARPRGGRRPRCTRSPRPGWPSTTSRPPARAGSRPRRASQLAVHVGDPVRFRWAGR